MMMMMEEKEEEEVIFFGYYNPVTALSTLPNGFWKARPHHRNPAINKMQLKKTIDSGKTP